MTGKAVQESRTEGGQAAAVASSAPVESIRPSTEEHAEEANGGGLAASAWQRTKELYRDNLGLFLVFLAQIFASIVLYALKPSSVRGHAADRLYRCP